MNEAQIIQHLTDSFADVHVHTSNGNHFFFVGQERHFPFATLMTNDDNDQASNLSRPEVCRLNIGLSKEWFRSLFDDLEGHDFSSLDQLMPHPVYGRMYWVCVLNPSDATFEAVKPLLAEAYERAAKKQLY